MCGVVWTEGVSQFEVGFEDIVMEGTDEGCGRRFFDNGEAAAFQSFE